MKDVVFHDCADQPGSILVSVGGEVPTSRQKGDIVGALNELSVSDYVSMRERLWELSDLLSSARAICHREGAETNWKRFDERIASFGISSVTAKVFKVLPSDREQ